MERHGPTGHRGREMLMNILERLWDWIRGLFNREDPPGSVTEVEVSLV